MRPERERGEEGETADDEDHADEQTDEQAAMGREGSGRGRHCLLRRERASNRHGRNDDEEAADQHRDSACDVVQKTCCR